jgi:hypothetical protein
MQPRTKLLGVGVHSRVCELRPQAIDEIIRLAGIVSMGTINSISQLTLDYWRVF